MLGTLKSSVPHSLLRRRAKYLVLNKRSKISTDFRLWKILMRIYLELHMTLKKRNVGTQERGKCTIRHIPTACRIEYELKNGQSWLFSLLKPENLRCMSHFCWVLLCKTCQAIGTSWKAKRIDGLPVSDMFMQVILVIMTGASFSSSLYFILYSNWVFYNH